jgi:hypothetical protein
MAWNLAAPLADYSTAVDTKATLLESGRHFSEAISALGREIDVARAGRHRLNSSCERLPSAGVPVTLAERRSLDRYRTATLCRLRGVAIGGRYGLQRRAE